ncbi:MAG: hypothetical protein JW797_02675, partial [Bradymonadales bacterium]|nr:hypothetical protein [Bradymonadales bacterium]
LVPLRIDAAGHPTLDGLAQHAAGRVQEAIEHSGMPFGNLVDDLKLVCNRWGVPGLGMQVNFTYYSASTGDSTADIPFFGKARPVPIGRKIREYDLYLFVRETEDGLRCTLRYNDSLLTADDAQRLLDRMQEEIGRKSS